MGLLLLCELMVSWWISKTNSVGEDSLDPLMLPDGLGIDAQLD